MVYVLTHLPAGYARTRRNLGGALTDLAYRGLDALLSRLVEPTARAFAEFFCRNKDTANRALRSLEVCGYVRRWKRSAGRGAWLNFVIVTDEPYAWDHDPALRERADEMEARAIERFQDHHRIEPWETEPSPPPPEPGSGQVTTCPGQSDPTSPDTPNRDSRSEMNPPKPPACGPARTPRARRPRRTPESLIRRVIRRQPELEPHMPHALALLHGMQMPPQERIRVAPVIARALMTGRSLQDILGWLTEGFDDAYRPDLLRQWRIDKLALSVGMAAPYKDRTRS